MPNALSCQVVADAATFAECRAIRLAVFVEEQHVPPEEEWDELDATATHVLARLGDTSVGTARLVVADQRARIGRMAVLREYRKQGAGSALMRCLLDIARSAALPEAYLAAQVHAIPFYERFGFTAQGPQFEEAGIPHRWMTLPLDGAEGTR